MCLAAKTLAMRLKAWHYQLPPSAPAIETSISVAKTDLTLDMVVGIKAVGGAN